MPLKGWHPPNVQPFAHEELAVDAITAVPLAGPNGKMENFELAWIEVEGAPMRMWYDGATPTTSAGHLWIPGQSDVLNFSEVRGLIAICTQGNGTLRASYYRNR